MWCIMLCITQNRSGDDVPNNRTPFLNEEKEDKYHIWNKRSFRDTEGLILIYITSFILIKAAQIFLDTYIFLIEYVYILLYIDKGKQLFLGTEGVLLYK
jgi:hypothetical protein